MQTPPKEIVELGKERDTILEMIDLGLVSEGSKQWERLKEVKRELAIQWNNLICD